MVDPFWLVCGFYAFFMCFSVEAVCGYQASSGWSVRITASPRRGRMKAAIGFRASLWATGETAASAASVAQ
jgi:hypothetical protein